MNLLKLLFLAALSTVIGYAIWHSLDEPIKSPSTIYVGEGTARMIKRLEKIALEQDANLNPFLNWERAQLDQKILDEMNLPFKNKVEIRIRRALELSRAGRNEKAVEEFTEILPLVARLPEDERQSTLWLAHQFLAIAYLRLGEQENCIAQHSSESCLMPIRGSGVHAAPRGSRAAIGEFLEALKINPGDLTSIWLMNIAHMTLGEYPDKVAKGKLIPPTAFQSDMDIRRFPDVAVQARVDARGHSGGSILEDFDGDGILDILCSSWGMHDPLRLFRNNGDGSFTERSREAGISGLTGGLNICHADYNNDGLPDVLVLRGAWLHDQGAHPNSLLRNNGNGTFDDAAERAGLLSFHPTQTAAWGDYDNDGWLDLYIGNESVEGEKFTHPCELYHNNSDGTFTECADQVGVDNVGFVKGVAWGDIDNDGWIDLYLSRFGETNVLYRNLGPGKTPPEAPAPRKPGTARPVDPWIFEDISISAGVTEPINSFPTWFFDYDNDGYLDLWVGSFGFEDSTSRIAADYLGIDNPGERPRLYHNRGNHTFSDETRSARVNRVLFAMGANYGDLDNDGWLDFYVGTGEPDLGALMPNRMFRSFEGKYFQDVTTSGGFGHLQKGHGIAFGDIDGDGDQDIYAVLGGAFEGDTFQNALFENPGHGNHWVTLRLEGVKSNRSAIGARIEISLRQAAGERKIFATVSTGGSFGSSSLQQEIGLGSAAVIDSLRIRWPSGGEPQEFKAIAADRVYKIREGEANLRAVESKKFTIGARSSPALNPPPKAPAGR